MSMRAARMIAGMALLSLALMAGCKKKAPATPPPQAQPPTATEPQPEQVPPPQAEPAPTQPEPSTTPPAETTASEPKPATPKKPAPPKPNSNKASAAKKTEPTPPRKPPKVVTEGGATENAGQLSAGAPHTVVEHQRASTTQLLDSTETNLKGLTRTLNSSEQAMVQQIRNYIRQSREATTQGDNERAYNLALKAHLLSDELTAKR
jgi:outer membrane biosynthesis protein TonB